MGILSQQLSISERATTNDIGVNPEARSLTKASGYFADGGKYPDNRSTFNNTSIVNSSGGIEEISESETAGSLGGLPITPSGNSDEENFMIKVMLDWQTAESTGQMKAFENKFKKLKGMSDIKKAIADWAD